MGEISKHEQDEPITPEPRGPNAEHLAEGFRPIMACVGTKEQYGEEISKLKKIEDASEEIGGVSRIDEKSKYTMGLCMCMSLAAVGYESGSQKELSFLTHELPVRLLDEAGDRRFKNNLGKALNELKRRCVEGSIDVVIMGGQFNFEEEDSYIRTLGKLASHVKKNLGFEPLVICGPKETDSDDVYLDTQKRRLYIIRPEGADLRSDVFKPSDIWSKIESWDNKLADELAEDANKKAA